MPEPTRVTKRSGFAVGTPRPVPVPAGGFGALCREAPSPSPSRCLGCRRCLTSEPPAKRRALVIPFFPIVWLLPSFFFFPSCSQCLLVFSHFSAQDLSAVLFTSSLLGWFGRSAELKGLWGCRRGAWRRASFQQVGARVGAVLLVRAPRSWCCACLWFSFSSGGDVPGSGGAPWGAFGLRFLPKGAPARKCWAARGVGRASPWGFLCAGGSS